MEAAMTMLERILSIKFNKTVICAALAASGTALVAAGAEGAKADDAMATKAPPIPYSNPAANNWNGFYAGGQMGYTWGTSNWTASSPGAPNVFRLAQSRAADRYLQRDRKLLRWIASCLQLHAAGPNFDRWRGRCDVPNFSRSGRHFYRRHNEPHFADAWGRNL